MAYLLDGLIIVLVALAIWSGYRRGFIKTITGLVAFVVAAVVASMLSGPVAQWVYDSTVEPPVVSTIGEYTQQTDSLESGIDEALNQMPDIVTNMLENNGITSGADVMAKLDAQVDSSTLAGEIADKVVEPLVIPLLNLVIMLVLFILVYILAAILLRVLNVVAKLPVLKQMNKVLGLVAGALSGVLWALFAASVLQVVAAFGGADGFITSAMLADTTIVNWLVSINPVGGMLREVTALVD